MDRELDRKMKKIGIFGGSFNPPHAGHIQAAKFAMSELGLDLLLMIPCSSNPGKGSTAIDAQHRLAMTELAVKDIPGIQVCDWDIQRGETTYTADTLRDVTAHYPDAKIYLLMGTDTFRTLPCWKDMQQVISNAAIAVFERGLPSEAETVKHVRLELEENGGEVILLKNPVNIISSTQIRRLIAFGATGDFLPEAVAGYISEHNLYNVHADWHNLPMEQLEAIVVSLLNPNRVRHVLGVRDTAVLMARKWGVNEEDAARAGILHDITKALDGPLQLTLCDGYGKILSDFSRRYPKTLHAYTGSLVAERLFGENAAVVDAICCHTTGKADMTDLEKIIYVADYMEPNRDFPGVETLRELAYSDLTGALKLGLEMTLEHLRNQGNEVSPESREALEFLR